MGEDSDIRAQTRAIARGDREAFARFYEAWFDRLYSLVRNSTKRDEAFCLDVMQDAMMKVIRSMRELESEAALAAWLRRVVLACAYDRMRAESRRAKREQAASTNEAAEATDGSDEHRERLEWLRGELGELDDRSLALIDARHRLGWTLERIGRVFGLAPGAVDGRIRRVLARLRRRGEEMRDE